MTGCRVSFSGQYEPVPWIKCLLGTTVVKLRMYGNILFFEQLCRMVVVRRSPRRSQFVDITEMEAEKIKNIVQSSGHCQKSLPMQRKTTTYSASACEASLLMRAFAVSDVRDNGEASCLCELVASR